MISVILGIGYFCVAWRWQSETGMPNPDMVELAERPSEIAHVKCAHEIMNKLLPNHLLSFQVMKKKNTGVKEVIQGHRAKTGQRIRSDFRRNLERQSLAQKPRPSGCARRNHAAAPKKFPGAPRCRRSCFKDFPDVEKRKQSYSQVSDSQARLQ